MTDNRTPAQALRIGCAGWQVPKSLAGRFGASGTHLQRYAATLPAVEINSCFYREHRPQTYEKWARETPADFRFALKMPRWLTHQDGRLQTQGLETFLEQAGHLGDKLGPLLLQLPPKLAFEESGVEAFLDTLRRLHSGPVVCEPRHASWLTESAERLLSDYRVARVAVDPQRHRGDTQPGGWGGLRYVRLHGYPERFRSEYDAGFLQTLRDQLQGYAQSVETWCIFNNTARDGGARNALQLQSSISHHSGS
ncbi:MAG: DUF72 domain-containing protein [Oleiphilaceae bacterium]|nr:DUF72 domain-containing protein [Oleiphilaceae bacterium]